MSENIPESIEYLTAQAVAGDEKAAGILFAIATRAVLDIQEVALKNPKVLLPFSRATPAFPAMICPNKSMDELHIQLLRNCETGSESNYNSLSTAAMNFNNPSKFAAAHLYQNMLEIREGNCRHPSPQINADCQNLGEPSRDSFKPWNRVMQEMLKWEQKENGLFNSIGKHWPEIWNSHMTLGQKVDQIKKQISQGFKTLLPER